MLLSDNVLAEVALLLKALTLFLFFFGFTSRRDLLVHWILLMCPREL